MQKIKRIPYGIGDFEAVNSKNEYYVDKTMYIPKLEMTRFIFFIRPRRFGKTLLLSTLQSYYDINKADRFEEFYQNTWILQNPTEERAKYMILYFNFSEVTKDKDKVQEDFNNYCCLKINSFLKTYQKYISKELIDTVLKLNSAQEKMYALSDGLENSEVKIYLMIDEYDNFANALIANYGTKEYEELTRNTGYFKQFFSNLKGMASGSGAGLARMFITGVSPVTMDDVTSGHNIGDNISTDEMFNEMLGFTEKDVSDIIDYYTSIGLFKLEKEQTMAVMKKWYDNYQFSEKATKKIYNTDAILYFIKKSFYLDEMITDLIDDNLRMDYGKLKHLIALDKGKERVLNGNFSKLKQIIEDNGIGSKVRKSFPNEKIGERENFVSLLLFFGLLTYSGKQYKGDPFLTIPNETIRTMIYEYIRSSYDDVGAFSVDIFELRNRIKNMSYDGDFKPVFEFIGEEINKQTKIRDYIEGEKVIQAFFMAYLNITDFYLSLSEEEMNKGYADIVLKPFYVKYKDIGYSYLFEMKYIKRTENKKELEEKLKKKIEESEEQLKKYSEDEYAKKMMSAEPYGTVKLKKGIIIFHGWELVYLEEFVI